MKTLPLTEIKSIENVELFFEHLVQRERLNFHPDSPFSDYTDEEGNIFYSAKEILLRDDLMNEAFDVCDSVGIDIYVVGQVILLEFINGMRGKP